MLLEANYFDFMVRTLLTSNSSAICCARIQSEIWTKALFIRVKSILCLRMRT
jgi:hypothetical protein